MKEKDIADYQKYLHQSVRRIKSNSSYSERRLKPNVPHTNDANVVVLINFIVLNNDIVPDYAHSVIGSIRHLAVFLKTDSQINKEMSNELFKKIDNCRKDIRTIAKKNAFWINMGKKPFNGLADFMGNAWLVLFKEDYEKIVLGLSLEEN